MMNGDAKEYREQRRNKKQEVSLPANMILSTLYSLL